MLPPIRSPTSRPVTTPMKFLREVPTTTGRPERGDLAEAGEQLEVVLDGLAEADTGVEPDPLRDDAGGDGRLAAARRGTRATSATTSS